MPEHNVCTMYVDKYSIFKQKIMNEILNIKLTIGQTRDFLIGQTKRAESLQSCQV